jgi:hypothetical protein
MFEDTDVPTVTQRVTTVAALLIPLGMLLFFAAYGVWCWLAH